jgi:hypothetical protein
LTLLSIWSATQQPKPTATQQKIKSVRYFEAAHNTPKANLQKIATFERGSFAGRW